jgi:hypothetical protein
VSVVSLFVCLFLVIRVVMFVVVALLLLHVCMRVHSASMYIVFLHITLLCVVCVCLFVRSFGKFVLASIWSCFIWVSLSRLCLLCFVFLLVSFFLC